MWDLVEKLGFEGGRVLEPGCGSGNFLGFAPSSAEVTGVELDPISAAIAEQLYGARAEVHTGGFEDFERPDGWFDLTIGNVPFGKITPHDPRHNRNRHSIHNYFLAKSVRLTRPGGLIVALTSRYTLGSRNPAARREIAAMADLVGAIRFPENTFAAAAGTKVVEDLLVLRRHDTDPTPEPRPGRRPMPAWTRAVALDLPELPSAGDDDAEPELIGEYFADHPNMVLGELTTGRGMYRDHELVVRDDGRLASNLGPTVETLVADATETGGLMAPAPPRVTDPGDHGSRRRAGSAEWNLEFAQEGSLVVGNGGVIGRYLDGVVSPFRPRIAKDTNELRRLIRLRDAARRVLDVQLTEGADDLSSAQQDLGKHYDDYVRLYGPLNRFTEGRRGQGDDSVLRTQPRMGGFRHSDPDWPLVSALEVFDDDAQKATKAAIFTQRVISPPPVRLGVETATDAVAVCLDETGTVTVDRVADLLGVDHDQARSELGELVYDDPESDSVVPAAQYLSGNIRHKLAAAEQAAEREPRFAVNVAALSQAMPRQLEPSEIKARLGAPWIPAADIEAFCDEVLRCEVSVEHLPEVAKWTVKRGTARSWVVLTSEWGTKRADAIVLLDAALSQRLHTVTDTVDVNGTDRRVRNDAETLAARDKQSALADRFSTWVWEDDERAQRLAGRYNQLFSSVALTKYDGSHLSLPGLTSSFELRPHQRDAVARIVTDGRALLAHMVGAGKTATMVTAAMELRRLGIVRKPAIVVPNHMLEQFSREWLQLYPRARVLIADKHQLSKQRREFVARCATGDWDGVVFTQSGFGRLPLGRELRTAYLEEQIDSARDARLRSKEGKGLSVKRLEKRIAQLEEMQERLLAADKKDDGVRWEETGIDYLFVDEAHGYKNLRIDTTIDAVSSSNSQRATDLDAKLWALRREHGPKATTFATATPIANSVAEMWVMQHYLQPDTLEDLGISHFDAWAANFGRLHTALELSPDATSYRMQTRFARFQNVPDLMGVYRQVADVRGPADLDLDIPKIEGGKPEIVVVPPSDELISYVADLAERAEKVRSRAVLPEKDNMLKVIGDGRRAALDLRLVHLDPDPDGGKIVAVARRIASTYEATKGNIYHGDDGQPEPRPGALQLVFCDASTPASTGWNVYAALRTELVRRKVPRDSIRFMQDAGSDAAKAELFAACRDGTVSVLIGSTETMGVGTNVQKRALALYHVDAPWRPADIEQREGRIVRQRNQNERVQIIRCVTQRSFDTYIWQTLERKATFIAQVTQGNVTEREIDDIGDDVLSYAEVKALSSGNPLIMEKAAVDSDVARLSRLEGAWRDDQHQLVKRLSDLEWRVARDTRRASDLEAVVNRLVDTRGDRFAMVVNGEEFTSRGDAGNRLRTLLADRLAATPANTIPEPSAVGQLGGLDVLAQTITEIEDEVRLLVPEANVDERFLKDEWSEAEPSHLVQRIERGLRRLPERLASLQADIAANTTEVDLANARVGAPFEHAQELARLRSRQQDIDQQLFGEPDQTASSGPTETAERPEVTDLRRRLDAMETREPPEPREPPDVAL